MTDGQTLAGWIAGTVLVLGLVVTFWLDHRAWRAPSARAGQRRHLWGRRK